MALQVPWSRGSTGLLLLSLCYILHHCHTAATCKDESQLDSRHPTGTVLKCLVSKTDDLETISAEVKALWLHFPEGHNVTFTAGGFPAMPELEYLKVDITHLSKFPPKVFENVYLPKIRSMMLMRDLNAVDTTNIAIVLENDTFVGLSKLENLYLDNLGIQTLEVGALRGLPALQTIDLTLNYLNEIKPRSFETCKNLTTLKLSDNFISRLDQESFSGLMNLASLDLSLNKLKRLKAGPLQHLLELELLVLTSNDLNVIESGAFSGQGKMHYLSLARNNLTIIKPMVFQGVTSLETLILDHNKLTLRMGQFAQISHLLHLYLAHNDIKDINPDYFEGLLSITELILSSNSITRLDTQAFYAMPTLVTLDVSDNKINIVEENAFQGLTELETLNIQENQIKTLPRNSFRDLTSIKTLYMDQNRWHCNCNVEWLILWLRARINKLEPNVQFYYIICKDDDLISMETFFSLIMSEHFINDLNCDGITSKSTSGSDTTALDKTSTQANQASTARAIASSTTEKTVIKVYNDHMNKAQKIAIIVCAVLAAMLVVLVVCLHLYCRKRKQRSWDPGQKPKAKGNDMTGHKKVPSSLSADPEAIYWARIWDTQRQHPASDEDVTDLVKAAYHTEQDHNHDHPLHIYRNYGISDSLEYLKKATDINHTRRGDMSDNEDNTDEAYHTGSKKGIMGRNNSKQVVKKSQSNHPIQTVEVSVEHVPYHKKKQKKDVNNIGKNRNMKGQQQPHLLGKDGYKPHIDASQHNKSHKSHKPAPYKGYGNSKGMISSPLNTQLKGQQNVRNKPSVLHPPHSSQNSNHVKHNQPGNNLHPAVQKDLIKKNQKAKPVRKSTPNSLPIRSSNNTEYGLNQKASELNSLKAPPQHSNNDNSGDILSDTDKTKSRRDSVISGSSLVEDDLGMEWDRSGDRSGDSAIHSPEDSGYNSHLGVMPEMVA